MPFHILHVTKVTLNVAHILDDKMLTSLFINVGLSSIV